MDVLYTSLVDGGNSQALLVDVENSYPEQMWTLYNDLLARSPHLSEKTLFAVADQTDVFPAGAIFDIMMANPDELKQYDLITYLETKDDPLPAYMIDILRGVVGGTTYKTVLQGQMSYYHRLMTRAANDMIRSLLNDTLTDLAQLRTWYGNLGGLRSGEQVVATYMQEGNYTQALALANAFPTTYKLTEEELGEHDFYMDMLNLEVTLAQQNRTELDLDSTELYEVGLIAAKSQGTAGAFARGLLQYAYGQHFCHCLNLDSGGYKHSGTANPGSLAEARGLSVTVSPNPSNEWAVFNYTLPLTETRAVLGITDAQGRLDGTYALQGREGQKLIDVRPLGPGIYFYTLTTGSLTQSGKMIVTR